MVSQRVNQIRKFDFSVRRKAMNIFSANGSVKRLNHNQNSTAKAETYICKTDIPTIVIEDSGNNVNSNHGSFPEDPCRRKSEPMTKGKEPRLKAVGGGSWLNLHWPERFRRGSSKKLEIEFEGHTLVFCTFKKPTFCDHCSRILTELHRQGYRCKKCRKTYHQDCSRVVDECQGSPIGTFGFSPQSSSNDDFNCLQAENHVDSVYQVIKEGMNLRAKKDYLDKPCSSSSDSSRKSLHHQLSEPLPNSTTSLPTDVKRNVNSLESLKMTGSPTTSRSSNSTLGRKFSQVLLLKQSDDSSFEIGSDVDSSSPAKHRSKAKQKKPDNENLFVALFKYEAQQKDDLSVKAGDVLKITDSKDDTWWTGEFENKSGFIPANFVMKLRSKEEVYSCSRSTILRSLNDKEQQLKRNQIVVVKTDWPVEDSDYLYVRCPSSEGYVRKEDLNPS